MLQRVSAEELFEKLVAIAKRKGSIPTTPLP